MNPISETTSRAHRAKGAKRVEFLVTPERKKQIDDYCQRNGTTASRLINTALANLLLQHRRKDNV